MYVLAHLSDPHLGPIPTPRLAELVNKRGLGLINWYRKRHRHHGADVVEAIVRDMHAQAPGHIAVTGDLVNVSLEAEFAAAARWLAQVGSPEHVTLVPGNHDAYIRRVAGSAAQHWGPYMHGDPLPDPQAGEGNKVVFPFVRRRGPVAIIGLTTSLPTGPFMATGRLGGEQLARLAEILITLGREPLFRVVLIHHPPIPNRRHYMKRLIDGPMLRAILAEHGAELVLHGHNHEQQLMWLDGPQGRIPAVGVPSCSAIISTHDEPAAYNLYRIDGGPGAWQCEMVARGLRQGREGITELTRRTLTEP
jgi:3',5'-cyclic AMP phosphodiesterase CpdA